MRESRRIKRMSRKRTIVTKMNLTSLMDVFTILVFFLLVNSGSVEVLDAPKDVKLPESMAQEKPRETVVIFVSPEEVLVQGELVAYTADILDTTNKASVGPVMARLAELSGSVVGVATKEIAKSQEVTILADKSVPFIVIKRIMTTCTGEGYEKVSLAVVQKASYANATQL
jgi:biopolymer transport protein ExbD